MIKGIRSFFYIGLVLLTILSCSQETASNGVEVINDQLDVDEEFVKQALALTKDNDQLVFSEGAFGAFGYSNLSYEINVESLTEKFSNYNIEILKYSGFSEEGENDYFVGWKGSSIFVVVPKFDNKYAVDNVRVESTGIVDEYGVKVGMTYKQLKMLRPNNGKIELNIVTQQPQLSFENSSIFYTFCCSDVQKEIYTTEDLMSMKIQSITWSSTINFPEH